MKFLPLGKFLVQKRGAAEGGSGQLHGLHSEETAGAGVLLQRKVGEGPWISATHPVPPREGGGNVSEGANAQELGLSERRPSSSGSAAAGEMRSDPEKIESTQRLSSGWGSRERNPSPEGTKSLSC